MRCPECGEEVMEGVMVCPHCSAMLPMTDDTYDSSNANVTNNNFSNYPNNTNNNYDSYSNYNNYSSGTYTSPYDNNYDNSYGNNNYGNNNYNNSGYNNNRKPKKIDKRLILIILAAVALIFIVYKSNSKNGTYVYKDEYSKIILKIDGDEFTLKTYVTDGSSLAKKYIYAGGYTGTVKFSGSKCKLTIAGETLYTGKYNRSKKTITFDLTDEYGPFKTTFKKKWFS